MRQKVFTLLLLSATGLLSCRKTKVEPDLKQYDQSQIENYISAHGLTGMKRDKNPDTTGIYYQIINPGDSVYNGTPIPRLDFPDKVAFVFTVRSFDGKFVSADTIANHYDDFLGHVASGTNKLPAGLQLSIYNILKHRGGSMRLLIPSHLAYGVNGYGSGSILNANSRIAGNQCLDYYVHVIGNIPTDNQATYDDLIIHNYMQANNLTDYVKAESTTLPGNFYYYKVLTPGTGSSVITDNSTITYTATGQLFNAIIFDNENATAGSTQPVFGLPQGVKEALENFATIGTKISILIPSALGYGQVPYGSVPPNSCLRYSYVISAVTQ